MLTLILSSSMVVLSSNSLYSALFLILSYLAAAITLLLLKSKFIAFFFYFNFQIFFIKTDIIHKNIMVYSLVKTITNNLFNIELIRFSLVPEFFLGFSALLLSIYISLIAYNQRYSFYLVQKILLAFSSILFLLTFILLINDYLLVTSKQISFNNLSFCNFLSLFSKLLLIMVSCFCL